MNGHADHRMHLPVRQPARGGPVQRASVTQVANNQAGAPPPYQLTFGYLQVACRRIATTTFNSPGNYSFTVPAE